MYVRGIAKASRWDKSQVPVLITRNDAMYTGDAIADLRTTENNLSVWVSADATIDSLKPIVVALALNRNDISPLTVVFLDESKLKDLEIVPKSYPNEGRAPGLNDQTIPNLHFNLIQIDYWRLGILAEYIYEIVEKGTPNVDYRTFLKDEVLGYLEEYRDNGQLDPLSVNKKIRQKLWPYLEIKKSAKLQAVFYDIKQLVGGNAYPISSVEKYLTSRFFDSDDIASILAQLSRNPDCKIESNCISFK